MIRFLSPRPIEATDSFDTFDCGEESLNAWLSDRAIRNERAGAARTLVSVEADGSIVAGYYCLSASSLVHADATPSLKRNMPDPIPIILIGRLAVDSRFHGTGLGSSLLKDAILRSVRAAGVVGARAIMVHALNDSARMFYAKFGFLPVPASERVMYILMKDAEATIEEVAG